MKVSLNVEKVKQIMEKKEWDEKELAEQMGVPYVTVYRVFRGQRNPGNEFIAKLLNACEGSDFEELFILDDVLPKGIEGAEENKEVKSST